MIAYAQTSIPSSIACRLIEYYGGAIRRIEGRGIHFTTDTFVSLRAILHSLKGATS